MDPFTVYVLLVKKKKHSLFGWLLCCDRTKREGRRRSRTEVAQSKNQVRNWTGSFAQSVLLLFTESTVL